MKINTQLRLVLVLCVLVSSYGFSQSKSDYKQPLQLVKYNPNVNAPLTTKELNQIKEVYGDKTQEDVLNHPKRVKDIKNILRNRVIINPIKAGESLKKCTLLSEVPLFDYYSPNIIRDASFNPESFNPLKYNFNFYSKESAMYRVDNSNYYIIILSQHQ